MIISLSGVDKMEDDINLKDEKGFYDESLKRRKKATREFHAKQAEEEFLKSKGKSDERIGKRFSREAKRNNKVADDLEAKVQNPDERGVGETIKGIVKGTAIAALIGASAYMAHNVPIASSTAERGSTIYQMTTNDLDMDSSDVGYVQERHQETFGGRPLYEGDEVNRYLNPFSRIRWE